MLQIIHNTSAHGFRALMWEPFHSLKTELGRLHSMLCYTEQRYACQTALTHCCTVVHRVDRWVGWQLDACLQLRFLFVCQVYHGMHDMYYGNSSGIEQMARVTAVLWLQVPNKGIAGSHCGCTPPEQNVLLLHAYIVYRHCTC